MISHNLLRRLSCVFCIKMSNKLCFTFCCVGSGNSSHIILSSSCVCVRSLRKRTAANVCIYITFLVSFLSFFDSWLIPFLRMSDLHIPLLPFYHLLVRELLCCCCCCCCCFTSLLSLTQLHIPLTASSGACEMNNLYASSAFLRVSLCVDCNCANRGGSCDVVISSCFYYYSCVCVLGCKE